MEEMAVAGKEVAATVEVAMGVEEMEVVWAVAKVAGQEVERVAAVMVAVVWEVARVGVARVVEREVVKVAVKVAVKVVAVWAVGMEVATVEAQEAVKVEGKAVERGRR